MTDFVWARSISIAFTACEKRGSTPKIRRCFGFGAGIDVGWRINLPAGFYLKPWVGFDFTFNPRDVTLGGQTFKGSIFNVFPAIHIGYRFR